MRTENCHGALTAGLNIQISIHLTLSVIVLFLMSGSNMPPNFTFATQSRCVCILFSLGNHYLKQHKENTWKENLHNKKNRGKKRIYFFPSGVPPHCLWLPEQAAASGSCPPCFPDLSGRSFSGETPLTELVAYLLGFLYAQNSTKRSIKERLMKLLPCSAAKTSSPAVQSKFVFCSPPHTVCLFCLGLHAFQFSASKMNWYIMFCKTTLLMYLCLLRYSGELLCNYKVLSIWQIDGTVSVTGPWASKHLEIFVWSEGWRLDSDNPWGSQQAA